MVANRRPNGAETIIEMGAIPVWQDEGGDHLVGVIQTMTDRTETAHKSRELTGAHQELRRLQAKLVQRTRTYALGQLASGAAHALNNFLNVLRLRVTLMRKDFKPAHLDAMDVTVKNIGDLVARLQEFTIDPDEETLVATDANRLITEAIDEARPDLAQGPGRVDIEVALSAQGEVRVDPTLFREMLFNLVLAARDRMPDGGRLKVSSRTLDDSLEVTIEDTGRSYSPEELTQLFDPLSGKPTAPQLSLLLAVGRAQVIRWGGELTCESRAGERGALFRLRLPLAAEARLEPRAAPPAAPAMVGRRPERRRRVLVVDDDADNAWMMAEVLGDEGYEVRVAHNGAEALIFWDEQPFDAALLDALMPDMSGWELAAALRKRSPQVLLAMVTGADVRGQNRSTLAQVDAVFRKPVDVGALDDFLTQTEDPHTGSDMPVMHGSAH
jgi:signal transduction histidine kinase/ActR/RegA family two-component response regulator